MQIVEALRNLLASAVALGNKRYQVDDGSITIHDVILGQPPVLLSCLYLPIWVSSDWPASGSPRKSNSPSDQACRAADSAGKWEELVDTDMGSLWRRLANVVVMPVTKYQWADKPSFREQGVSHTRLANHQLRGQTRL